VEGILEDLNYKMYKKYAQKFKKYINVTIKIQYLVYKQHLKQLNK